MFTLTWQNNQRLYSEYYRKIGQEIRKYATTDIEKRRIEARKEEKNRKEKGKLH